MRQMVKLASITKIFEKSTEVPGTYNVKILTTKKNVEWKNIPFAQEFQGEYLDDSQHKVRKLKNWRLYQLKDLKPKTYFRSRSTTTPLRMSSKKLISTLTNHPRNLMYIPTRGKLVPMENILSW